MSNEAVLAVTEVGAGIVSNQETQAPSGPALSSPEGRNGPPPPIVPPRKWGRYHLYRNDGTTRKLPRFVQVKLVNFLFAFAPRACIVEGLDAAGITRRTYNRWLLAIPASALRCPEACREDHAADTCPTLRRVQRTQRPAVLRPWAERIRDEHTDRDELELDARIRKGDGAALRMKLRANRPEKYDPRWRRAATADAAPVAATSLLPLPQHRAPKPRIGLVHTALAHRAAWPAAAALTPPRSTVKKKSFWDDIEVAPPVLR